ncbi:MAG: hypothetical protein ACP5TL_00580 [Candidatus Micrarchaeia archaeon]
MQHKKVTPITNSKESGAAKGTKNSMPYYSIYVIVVFLAFDILLFVYHPSEHQPFYTFASNFHSASHVAIYVEALNGSALSSTIGCASMLIESIVSSKQYHRDPSSIDFFVMNQTACFTNAKILGESSNSSEMPISACLNVSKTIPSIFINYSNINNTIVTQKSLYISGNINFLRECGIAPAIS